VDPVAFAAAHRAAITALEAVGDTTHAEILRVQGTEVLRLARLGQAQHQAQGRETDPAKAETEAIVNPARHHG
jgi:hypothetical protein